MQSDGNKPKAQPVKLKAWGERRYDSLREVAKRASQAWLDEPTPENRRAAQAALDHAAVAGMLIPPASTGDYADQLQLVCHDVDPTEGVIHDTIRGLMGHSDYEYLAEQHERSSRQ